MTTDRIDEDVARAGDRRAAVEALDRGPGLIIEFHRRVGEQFLLVARIGLVVGELRGDRLPLVLQFGAFFVLQVLAREFAVEPLQFGGGLRLERLKLGDLRAGVGAGDLGIDQFALRGGDRVDALLAERTGEARGRV